MWFFVRQCFHQWTSWERGWVRAWGSAWGINFFSHFSLSIFSFFLSCQAGPVSSFTLLFLLPVLHLFLGLVRSTSCLPLLLLLWFLVFLTTPRKWRFGGGSKSFHWRRISAIFSESRVTCADLGKKKTVWYFAKHHRWGCCRSVKKETWSLVDGGLDPGPVLSMV